MAAVSCRGWKMNQVASHRRRFYAPMPACNVTHSLTHSLPPSCLVMHMTNRCPTVYSLGRWRMSARYATHPPFPTTSFPRSSTSSSSAKGLAQKKEKKTCRIPSPDLTTTNPFPLLLHSTHHIGCRTKPLVIKQEKKRGGIRLTGLALLFKPISSCS